MLYRAQIFLKDKFINQTEPTSERRAIALARAWHELHTNHYKSVRVVDEDNHIIWRPSDDINPICS